MEEELGAVDSFQKNKKVKKRKFKEIDEKITDCLDPRKIKTVVEFSDRESASIKYFAVIKRNKIKVATPLMPVKLLMFANLSLTSFIYGLTENFCFPLLIYTKNI